MFQEIDVPISADAPRLADTSPQDFHSITRRRNRSSNGQLRRTEPLLRVFLFRATTALQSASRNSRDEIGPARVGKRLSAGAGVMPRMTDRRFAPRSSRDFQTGLNAIMIRLDGYTVSIRFEVRFTHVSIRPGRVGPARRPHAADPASRCVSPSIQASTAERTSSPTDTAPGNKVLEAPARTPPGGNRRSRCRAEINVTAAVFGRPVGLSRRGVPPLSRFLRPCQPTLGARCLPKYRPKLLRFWESASAVARAICSTTYWAIPSTALPSSVSADGPASRTHPRLLRDEPRISGRQRHGASCGDTT